MTGKPAPTIAVITPALNAAAHLGTALASLARQGVDVEAVLVDGGSSDDTPSMAADHGVRVVSAPGTSIYQAINRGIAETRADAIVLLNADDILLPGAVAAWRDALAQAPECGIARGRSVYVRRDARGAETAVAQRRTAGPLTIEYVLRGPGDINTLCIRRTVFDAIGPFDTAYRFAADRALILRAWLAGVKFAEIGNQVYRYLSHAGSQTMDRSRRNHAAIRREHLDIAARALAGAGGRDPQVARALRRWHAAETGMLAWHQSRRGQLRALAPTLGQATRLDRWWPLLLAGEAARRLIPQR
jgi:glycosyltransferase involved in cell wall biosynthesis